MVKSYAVPWFLIAIAVAIVAVGDYSAREMSDRFVVIALTSAVVAALSTLAVRVRGGAVD